MSAKQRSKKKIEILSTYYFSWDLENHQKVNQKILVDHKRYVTFQFEMLILALIDSWVQTLVVFFDFYYGFILNFLYSLFQVFRYDYLEDDFGAFSTSKNT